MAATAPDAPTSRAPRADEADPTGHEGTPGSVDDKRLIAARWLLGVEGAGFAFVRVPEPIPHASGDPALAGCRCGPGSTTRRRDGQCASPGKHPDGEAWQRSGSRDPMVIAGILRNPGYQLGVIVQPGGRGFILDEDLGKGVDADASIAEWCHVSGLPPVTTLIIRTGGGGRHLYGLAPEGYRFRGTWAGGEVRWAGDGTRSGGMVVAPFGLHRSGATYEPEVRALLAEFPAGLLDHIVGVHAAGGDSGAHERARDEAGFRVPLPGESWYALVNSWCGRLRYLGRTDGEAWARVLELAAMLTDWDTRRDLGDGCADRTAHLRHRFDACWPDAKRDFAPEGEGIHISFGKEGSKGSATPSEGAWPTPMADEARHGFIGRYVAAVEPWSEADPAAILMQALATIGSIVGPSVHAVAGDAEHPARLNVLTVGPTGKGRKDTAGRPALRLAGLVDPYLNIAEGLSSGEGLIWAVRDPIEKMVPVGRGAERHLELQLVDEGVSDKRLLVRESEFAQVLRMSQRDGNILSQVVRRAWETGDLRTLTKNEPARATGAHIVITGNITRDELLRYLDRIEVASGFMNRFLPCAARRVKLLPDGEGVPADVLAGLARELAPVIPWAADRRQLHRDEDASRIWHSVYERLSDGHPGLMGAATSRAEAYVLRLSVAYAILDRSEAIRAPHLMAALAVWQYAVDSARWVFGDATGDPVADAIMAALVARGSMTRTDIGDLFGRHVQRATIERALAGLAAGGRVRCTREMTGGRPSERWHVA